MYWRVAGDPRAGFDVLRPEPVDDPLGRLAPGVPVLHGAALWKQVQCGRGIVPADCGPVRLISRFGFVALCPGEAVIWRLDAPSPWCQREDEWATFGLCGVAGTRWPASDSGFVASWVAGSEYAKIHTGVEVLFEADKLLYLGPPPNCTVTDCGGKPVEVIAGLDYSRSERTETVAGRLYGVSELNVVVKLPEAGSKVRITRGTRLCWFFQTAPMQSQTLHPWTVDGAPAYLRQPVAVPRRQVRSPEGG